MKVGRLIQGLILFSAVLGALFLWEVYPLLPISVFQFLTGGWILYLVDGALTFVKPRASYYLALVLAPLTLAATLSQPEHYSLVSAGDLEATATLLLGSAAQAGIVVSVLYFLVTNRART